MFAKAHHRPFLFTFRVLQSAKASYHRPGEDKNESLHNSLPLLFKKSDEKKLENPDEFNSLCNHSLNTCNGSDALSGT